MWSLVRVTNERLGHIKYSQRLTTVYLLSPNVLYFPYGKYSKLLSGKVVMHIVESRGLRAFQWCECFYN